MNPADELKKIAEGLEKTAQPLDPAEEKLKEETIQKVLTAIPKADFNKAIDYFDSVVRKGFDGFESEFRISIIQTALDEVLGKTDADLADDFEIWNEERIDEALAKTVWATIIGSGKNFIKFLY